MTDLCIKPSGLPESKGKAFQLVIRDHGPVETTYTHIAYLSDEMAVEVIKAGEPYWLYGEPDWDKREIAKRKERARVLRAQADELDSSE